MIIPNHVYVMAVLHGMPWLKEVIYGDNRDQTSGLEPHLGVCRPILSRPVVSTCLSPPRHKCVFLYILSIDPGKLWGWLLCSHAYFWRWTPSIFSQPQCTWACLKIWHTPKIQWCRPHFPSGRMALTCGQITPSSGDHLVGDSEYIPIPPTIHWFPPVPYIPSLSPLTHASVARVCMRISPASSTACCSAGCPTRWSMPSSEGRCRRSGSSFAPRQQTPIGWNVRFLFCAANFGILWILSDFKWS